MSPVCTLLYLQSVLWSAQHETDGHIPVDVLPQIAAVAGVPSNWAQRRARQLVARRLWLDLPSDQGGWQIVGYLDWQPSRVENEASRAAAAERQRRARERKSRSDSRRDTNESHAVSHTTTTRHDTTRHEVSTNGVLPLTSHLLSSIDDEIGRSR